MTPEVYGGTRKPASWRQVCALIAAALFFPGTLPAASHPIPGDPFERARQALSRQPPQRVLSPTPAPVLRRPESPPSPEDSSVAPSAPPVPPAPPKIETKSEAPPVRITGRLQFDFRQHTDTVSENIVTKETTSRLFDIRRARVDFRGAVVPARYKFSLELANTVEVKDAFMDFPLPKVDGKLRLGQFSYPFPAENLNSNRYYEFLEAASISDGISPGRDRGVAYIGKALNDRLFFMLSAVNGTGDVKPDRNENMDYVAEAQALPFSSDDGSVRLWLVGAFATGKRASSEQEEIEFTPETRGNLTYFSAKMPEKTTYTRQRASIDAKLAFKRLVAGGEFVRTSYTIENAATISGWYGYLSYMLTDDIRTIDEGFLERQTVNHPITEPGQYGAWELAARYSQFTIDRLFFADATLNAVWKKVDPVANATRGTAISVGLNWYPTKQTRVMLNWVQSTAYAFDDETLTTSAAVLAKQSALLMRTQIEF